MGVLFRMTFRDLFGGRRAIGLALLPLAVAAAAVAYAVSGADTEPGAPTEAQVWASLSQTVLLPTLIAFMALVLGSSALGDLREDGSIVYLVASPINRSKLVAATALAAAAVTLVLALPGTLIAIWATIGSDPSALGWTLLAVFGEAAAYAGISAWLAMAVRRPVLTGFLYVVLWEASIATFAPSARWLSVGAYGRVVSHEGNPPGTDPYNIPDTEPLLALIVLACVATAFTLLAARMLRRAELP